jgi:hypothetical protein
MGKDMEYKQIQLPTTQELEDAAVIISMILESYGVLHAFVGDWAITALDGLERECPCLEVLVDKDVGIVNERLYIDSSDPTSNVKATRHANTIVFVVNVNSPGEQGVALRIIKTGTNGFPEVLSGRGVDDSDDGSTHGYTFDRITIEQNGTKHSLPVLKARLLLLQSIEAFNDFKVDEGGEYASGVYIKNNVGISRRCWRW